MKLKSFFLWLIWISLSPICIYGAASEPVFQTTFFKVGQGNCTLVELPDGDKMQFILVDCGTSTTVKNRWVEGLPSRFIHKINQYKIARGITVNLDVHVVISHADEDHYNLIKDVFANKAVCRECRINSVLLGDTRAEWEGKPSAGRFIEWINTFKGTFDNPEIYFENFANPMECPVILARKPDNREDISLFMKRDGTGSNDRSLVLGVNYKGVRMILPGDATKQTTNYVLSLFHEPVSILQAAHHGSGDDEFDASDWYDTLKPRVCIISAGLQHKHPRREAVYQCMKVCPDSIAATPHGVTYYDVLTKCEKCSGCRVGEDCEVWVDKFKDSTTETGLPRRYLVKEVRNMDVVGKPVYATHDQRDITITRGADGAIRATYFRERGHGAVAAPAAGGAGGAAAIAVGAAGLEEVTDIIPIT